MLTSISISSNYMKNLAFSELTKLLDKLKHENNVAYRVMLFTNGGTIVGDMEPCSPKSDLIKYSDDPNDITLDMSAFFGELSRQCKLDEKYSDDYLLNIKDAVVYRPGTKEKIMEVEQLILFTDQVVGFTLIKNDIQ